MAKRNKSKKIEDALERLVLLAESDKQDRADLKRERADLKKEQKESSKQRVSMEKSLKELPGIKQLYAITGNEITKSLNASFKLQERGLARGMNITQALDRNAETITHLRTNIQGFAGAVAVSMDMWESGLRDGNKEMATLGAMTKVTGGNTKKLSKAMAKNTHGLGISQEGISNLATTTMSMSQQYGISTEELVDSLGAFGDQLASYGALGIAAEMQEAGMRLGAALGPAMADVGPKLLGAFTQGSSMVQASLLGISNQREKLIKGEGDMNRNAFDLVITAGRNSKKILEQFTKGARDPAFALEKATDIYGTQILDAKRAYEQMEKSAKAQGLSIESYANKVAEEQKVNEEFTQTWENLKNKILAPLQRTFVYLGNGLLKVFGWIEKVPLLKVALQGLIAIIATWIAAIKIKQAGSAIRNVMGAAGAAGKAGKAGKAGAAGAAGKVGRAGEGIMGGLGKGLKGLGAGLKAIGNPAAMKGAITILILATSLIPFAFALKMMKGVGMDTMKVMAVGILVLAAAVMAIGLIMMSGIGAAAIIAGAGAFTIMAIALIPLAYAMNLAAPAADMFIVSLAKVADVPIGKVFLLGPALVSLGLGLLAFNAMGVASGVLGAIGSFLSGGKSPLDKLVTIGKSADSILKLSDALKAIPSALDSIAASLKNITDKELNKLHAIASLGFMIGLGAADISVASESIAKSSVSPAEDEQVQLLKQAVERLETINEALDGANEQRSTANSQRNEQIQNTKTRPSEMGGK